MKMRKIDSKLKKRILKRDNFTCQKCGFQSNSLISLEIHHITPLVFRGTNTFENLITLCSICHHYAPDKKEDFIQYLEEKIDGKILETFRKASFSIGDRTKFGMERKAREGGFITKAPKGYSLVNKELIIHEQEAEKVKEIFEEFLNLDISLTQLAKKHGMTTAGIKKLLKNTTYLGKVKFAGQESKGQHKPIIEDDLFKDVQNRME